MDYSEHLDTIKNGFETIKKSLDYFESYIDVNYVEQEDELMEIITKGKGVISDWLNDLDYKIESCNDGEDTLTQEDFLKLIDFTRTADRMLYHLNIAIFEDVLVGYSIVGVYGMPDEEDAVESDEEDVASTAHEKFLAMSLDERMEILGVNDYTTMCKDFSEYVTHEEFEELLELGQIYSVDNIIEFKGRYYDNEFSEESLDRDLSFKKQINRSNTKSVNTQYREEFPHDYFQEQLSDLEDMEYYGSDMSPEEISDAYNDVLDEYADALEEYNSDRNNS